MKRTEWEWLLESSVSVCFGFILFVMVRKFFNVCFECTISYFTDCCVMLWATYFRFKYLTML